MTASVVSGQNSTSSFGEPPHASRNAARGVRSLPVMHSGPGEPARAGPCKGQVRPMELQVLNTAELVLLAQSGDRTAFGELVRRFQAPVYAAALEKLREPGEAQELA